MAGKQNFVRTVREATQNDIDKLDKFSANVPLYEIGLIDSLKLGTLENDALVKTMNKQTPKNIVRATKTVKDGFVDLFQAIAKTTDNYTDVIDVNVTVLTIIDGNKCIFEGQIVGKNGYVVAVLVNGHTILCPIQGDCWLFN